MKKAASSSVADQIESASGSFEVCLKYVPYDAKEEEMKEFFSECGEIDGRVRLLRDQPVAARRADAQLPVDAAQPRRREHGSVAQPLHELGALLLPHLAEGGGGLLLDARLEQLVPELGRRRRQVGGLLEDERARAEEQLQLLVAEAEELAQRGLLLGGDAGLVNLYNALVLHGTALLGPPEDTPAARGAFFSGATGATYEVCGAELSLDDLEHALLRRGGAPGDARAFAAGDPRRATFAATLARPFDPRIHFALNCGARSCPPVKLFREATLDGDLAAAARAFVASETSVSGATVTTSKLLLWYGACLLYTSPSPRD